MLRRLAPAALGACGAWRLRRLAPAALGAFGAWRLRRLRPPEAQNEPKSVFSGCPQSDVIVIDHFWGRWTLPTCSNMPYTTSIPTIVCLVWPLEASKGPKRPKWAQMSVSGRSQSDIIVTVHFWGRWMLPTCSNMPYTTSIPTNVCLVWPLEASKGPKRPKWALNECFRDVPRVILS